MWSKKFWMDTAERAIRTAAQVALVSYVTLEATSWDSWAQFGLLVGGAAVASVLTSLVASRVGSPADASFVTAKKPVIK